MRDGATANVLVVIVLVVALIAGGVILTVLGVSLVQQSDANVQRIINECPPGVPCAPPSPGPEQPEGMLGGLLEVAGYSAFVGAAVVAGLFIQSRRGKHPARGSPKSLNGL